MVRTVTEDSAPPSASLSDEERGLVERARDLCQRAYAPYSKYSVGAVLLADELTAALDDDHAAAVVELVASWVADGGSLLFIAHDATRWAALNADRLQLPPTRAAAS